MAERSCPLGTGGELDIQGKGLREHRAAVLEEWAGNETASSGLEVPFASPASWIRVTLLSVTQLTDATMGAAPSHSNGRFHLISGGCSVKVRESALWWLGGDDRLGAEGTWDKDRTTPGSPYAVVSELWPASPSPHFSLCPGFPGMLVQETISKQYHFFDILSNPVESKSCQGSTRAIGHSRTPDPSQKSGDSSSACHRASLGPVVKRPMSS